MAALLSSAALACALALAFASILQSGHGTISYPLLITGVALLRILLWLVPQARRAFFAAPADEELSEVAAFGGESEMTFRSWGRLLGFAGVWILYVLVLPVLGFLVSSIAALLLSLWLASGRLSLKGGLSCVLFVLVLAVLVSTVLYIPVPKSGVDYWLDETIYTMFGG